MARLKELEAENARLEDVYRRAPEGRDRQGNPRKKVVKPSRRREMAHQAMQRRGTSIRLACRAFGISEICYRHQVKCSAENAGIADHLIRLTHN